MNYLEQRSHDLGAKLKHYASGDGSLSFVWDNRGKATGDAVTMKDAQAFMAANFDFFEGWKLLDRYGIPKAYKPVERISFDVVAIGTMRRYYRYVMGPRGLDIYELGQDNDTYHVKNLNIIGQIQFFLENEGLIK